MGPRLRLNRDESPDRPGAAVAEDALRPLPFPSKAWACRLVAGRVDCSPTDPEAAVDPHFDFRSGPAIAGRIVPTGELIRRVEGTLGRMQKRLDRVREDLDVVFRFPDHHEQPEDEDRPRAA